jgi:hypothetical protein
MNAQRDPLYCVHQAQATRRGLPPLPYADFATRLPATYETDLTGLLPRSAGFTVQIQVTRPPKFPLGRLCITPAAAKAVPAEEVLRAIARHAAGDWGDLDASDTQANETALQHGGRLFSVYAASTGQKFYVITESDWSATTLLLPEYY